MNKNKVFLLIALFWIIIIFGFIGVKEYTLKTGEEVILKTRPVDPRDFFRGDYVILNYEISTLDLASLEADTFNVDDKIYVTLNQQDGFGIPSGAYRTSPEEGLFIKGTVKEVKDDRVDIEYGIESYFVPEGEGKVIERQRSGNVDVKVVIDKYGTAMIKAVLIDGEEVIFN
ncbi:GDYXXLXY domain-containing protein [Nanoarchaeota archaeon]